MTTFYRDRGSYSILLDDPDSSTTYVGKAPFATATSSAGWQIRKILSSGTVTSILWADGNDNFDNIWDNRTSLTYS